MKVAIFDFDGTLYKEETFPLMMHYLKNHPTENKRYRAFLTSLLPTYTLYKLKLCPEAKMKNKSMQVYIKSLNGLTKQEVDVFFGVVAKTMATQFNLDVLAKLKAHQKNGDYTMLVSGAFTPLLTAAVPDLGFDTVIGTPIPFTENRVDASGGIDHIQNIRKTEVIKEILAKETVDWKNSTTYSDSISDLPILQLVGNPIAVQPDEALKKHAIAENWVIL